MADEHWARGEAEGRRRVRLDTLALEARKGELLADLDDLAEKLSSKPARRRQVDLVRQWIEDAETAEELSDFTVQATDDESPQQAPLLDPSASSGLAVSLSVDASTTDGSCSLSGDTVNYLNPGMCVIDANQAGDAEDLAAPRVQQSVLVSPGPPDIAVAAEGLDGALWVQVSQFSVGGFSQLSGGLVVAGRPDHRRPGGGRRAPDLGKSGLIQVALVRSVMG